MDYMDKGLAEYEDYSILRIQSTHKPGLLYEIVVYATFFVLLAAIAINLICLFYLTRLDKFKKNCVYQLLFHFFFLKLIHLVVGLKSILMTETINSFESSPFLFFLEYFATDFSDSSANFILFTIWLVFMSQRNMIAFEFFYIRPTELASPNLMSESSRLQRLVQFLKEKNVFLISFYSVNFVYSFVNATKYGGNHVCGSMHNTATYLNSIHLIPLAFWLLTVSGLFWHYFGGKRDPIYHDLTHTQINLCAYIKLTSLLYCFEVCLNHSYEFFAFEGIIVEYQCNRIIHFVLITKMLAAVCTLALMILFLVYENMFTLSFCMFWRRNRTRNHILQSNSSTTSTQQIYNNSFESLQ